MKEQMSAASQKDAKLRAAEKVLVRARALKAAGDYAAAQGEFFEAGSYLQGAMAFETHKSGQDAIKKKLLEIIMEGEECKNICVRVPQAVPVPVPAHSARLRCALRFYVFQE